MNLYNVFQLKQVFIVVKCNMEEKLEHKRSIHVCVARCLSSILRAALTVVSPLGFNSSPHGVCPPPKSVVVVGISVCFS